MAEYPPHISADSPHYILLTACAEGNVDQVAAQVARGFDVRGVKDDEDNTCLGLAVFNQQVDLVKYLVEQGCNAAEGDKYGTVLMTACGDAGNLNIVKYLVDHGADVTVHNDVGNTCIGLAESFGRDDVVQYLKSLPGERGTEMPEKG
jgi:ankyrin repeat protein